MNLRTTEDVGLYHHPLLYGREARPTECERHTALHGSPSKPARPTTHLFPAGGMLLEVSHFLT